MNTILQNQKRSVGVKSTEKMVECQYCGGKMLSGFEFCGYCGHPIDIESWLPLEPLKNPLQFVTTAIVVITPEMADKLLGGQVLNRKQRNNQIEKLMEILKIGDWKMNGQPIILDEYGRNINGQHRLSACVKSNISMMVLVVKGVPYNVFLTLDQIEKRNIADQLFIMYPKRKYHTATGTVLNLLCQFDVASKGKVPLGAILSMQNLLDKYEQNPAIQNCVEFAHKLPPAGCVNFTRNAWGVFLVRAKELHDTLGDEFALRYANSIGFGEGSPLSALRARDVAIGSKKKRSGGDGGYKLYVLLAIITKAWNAWVKEQKVNAKSIDWNSSYKRYPTMMEIPSEFVAKYERGEI